MAEIKERADQKTRGNSRDSPVSEYPMVPVSTISHDPVTQLVTELSESLNLDGEKSTLRKTSQGNLLPLVKTTESNGTGVPQLKKVENAMKKTGPKDKQESNDSSIIIDFKSRLRKVDNNSEKKQEEDDARNSVETEDASKRESTASSDSGNLKIEDGDDKRKSTGSISSLKKIWETKESAESINIQLSPKLSLKTNKNDEASENSPVDTSDDSSKIILKVEKRVWPPQSEEKPIIPTKPMLKAIKPVMMNRAGGSAIYATPIANSGTKPPISAKPLNIESKTVTDDDVKLSTTTEKRGKEGIVEISQALETTLNNIKACSTVSSSTWIQISDKIHTLHGSCMDYSDNVVPAHTKFHFRELLTRLEAQARQLRSAGSRISSENSRYLNEVLNTIKDVVNVVLR